MKGNNEMYQYFYAAFCHMIDGKVKKKPNGKPAKQIDIATELDITPDYLNALYKRRKKSDGASILASLSLQEKIAKYYGYSLFDFIELGKRLSQTQTINGNDNIQVGGDLASGGDMLLNSVAGQVNINPQIRELVNLLAVCASPLEIKMLVEKYQDRKRELEEEWKGSSSGQGGKETDK